MCCNIPTKVKIAGIEKNSVVDGEGIRYVIFVQGCSHKCIGCHNASTWNPFKGEWTDLAQLCINLNSLSPYYDGITLSGGEPFEQEEACVYIAKYAQSKNLSVWCYTGYDLNELPPQKHPLFRYIDVIVSGPYIEDLKTSDFPYIGSSNQHINYVVKEIPDKFLDGDIQISFKPYLK